MRKDSAARAWLGLTAIEGLRRKWIIELVRRVGSAPAVFQAGRAELCRLGVEPAAAEAIAGFEGWKGVDEELARMEDAGASLVAWDARSYPALLRHIHDPPPWLVVRGSQALGGAQVAIVGARRASPYGLEVAQDLGRGLAQAGLVVVSGLALGIDGAAHRGCLCAGGRTIAVLGSGLDVVYPPQHQALAEEVARQGALVSELPMGTPPRPSHFPSRNRIIAGMAMAVVVVEAGRRSGSLITASMALENGREVFAVPGRVDSPLSQGTNELIKEGAVLVTSTREIITCIAPALCSATELGGSAHRRRSLSDPILDLFDAGPLTADQFIEASGMDASRAAAKLLELELKGSLIKVPGERFERGK